jgi:aspartyl-tRNA(Asn)/glutamyl-tRNA(Gln) amidotransferase subunit C
VVHPDEVRHVARLARLALTPAEAEEAAGQLGRILEYVELLREVEAGEDDAAAPPSEPPAAASPGDPAASAAVLRPDEPGATLTRAEALAAAPKTDGETFLVPPVLDGGGTA